jgi:hypothetical protein
MQLTKEMCQRIVQHQAHSMAIIDRAFPDTEHKLALVGKIQDHLSGKNIQSPEHMEGWLKYLVVFLYQDILDAADNTDE